MEIPAVSNNSNKGQQRNARKSPCHDLESSSDGEDNTTNMLPRFLVVQGRIAEFPLAKLNPFALYIQQ